MNGARKQSGLWWKLPMLLAALALAGWLGFRMGEGGGFRTGAQGPQGREQGRLEEDFEAWKRQPALAAALVGFCVLDERGESVFSSPLAETALCPASALKTLTSGAAFEVLGEEFRFETLLCGTAAVDAEGVLAGDLVLVGSGDPTLEQGDLERLADEVAARGVKVVSGRLVVDASAFPDHPVSDHWNWGDIGNAYGAGAFGVNVNHNRLVVRFDPAEQVGEAARWLGGGPAGKELQWDSRVTTGPRGSGDRVMVYSAPYGKTITLRGSVPLGERGFAVTGAIPDPPAWARELLQERLEQAGVRWLHQPVPAGERLVLASHHSAALPEIVDHLHEVSDNLETQCLFLAIGRRLQRPPAQAVRELWERKGVSFAGLRLEDGSGLARANMIRPLDLARVNWAARHSAWGERFLQSLKSSSGGAVRAKNGAMSGVRTEVGFLRLADGTELTFALMMNGLGGGVDYWKLRGELLAKVRSAGF